MQFVSLIAQHAVGINTKEARSDRRRKLISDESKSEESLDYNARIGEDSQFWT